LKDNPPKEEEEEEEEEEEKEAIETIKSFEYIINLIDHGAQFICILHFWAPMPPMPPIPPIREIVH